MLLKITILLQILAFCYSYEQVNKLCHNVEMLWRADGKFFTIVIDSYYIVNVTRYFPEIELQGLEERVRQVLLDELMIYPNSTEKKRINLRLRQSDFKFRLRKRRNAEKQEEFFELARIIVAIHEDNEIPISYDDLLDFHLNQIKTSHPSFKVPFSKETLLNIRIATINRFIREGNRSKVEMLFMIPMTSGNPDKTNCQDFKNLPPFYHVENKSNKERKVTDYRQIESKREIVNGCRIAFGNSGGCEPIHACKQHCENGFSCVELENSSNQCIDLKCPANFIQRDNRCYQTRYGKEIFIYKSVLIIPVNHNLQYVFKTLKKSKIVYFKIINGYKGSEVNESYFIVSSNYSNHRLELAKSIVRKQNFIIDTKFLSIDGSEHRFIVNVFVN